MKRLFFTIVIVFIIITTTKITAQNGMFMMCGYGLEQYQNTDAITLVVNDYNNHNTSIGLIAKNKLKSPGLFKGIKLGMKSKVGRMTMSFDLNYSQFKSTAVSNDSLYSSEYFTKIKIGNVGFSLNYALNLINLEYFRTGPGLSLNIEKFRMYCRKDKSYGTSAYEKPVDKFMMSASARWPLSFGGMKFNIDIIPYYTLPFWKVDASLFNSEELNMGYHTAYTKDQMTINPVRWGVEVVLNFGIKE
ncbi:MAG: hypothetical protein PHT69_01875 [Bacteroidales bacterium]|nr:hypothetical protein [Bacteroidales bacterium]